MKIKPCVQLWPIHSIHTPRWKFCTSYLFWFLVLGKMRCYATAIFFHSQLAFKIKIEMNVVLMCQCTMHCTYNFFRQTLQKKWPGHGSQLAFACLHIPHTKIMVLDVMSNNITAVVSMADVTNLWWEQYKHLRINPWARVSLNKQLALDEAAQIKRRREIMDRAVKLIWPSEKSSLINSFRLRHRESLLGIISWR